MDTRSLIDPKDRNKLMDIGQINKFKNFRFKK